MDDNKKVDLDAAVRAFLDLDRPPSMPIKAVAGAMVGVLFYTHAYADFDRTSPPYPPAEHVEQATATSTSSLDARFYIIQPKFDGSALKSRT